MMLIRTFAALIAPGTIVACTTVAPGPDVMLEPPRAIAGERVPPKPAPLPSLSTPYRTQRAVQVMSLSEFANWVLPGGTARFAKLELVPHRWGRLTYGILWEAPRPAGFRGMCEINGTGIGFQIVNENNLSPEETVDPPLRPYGKFAERRWKVIGSTTGPHPTTAECGAAAPHWQWLSGPSPEAIHQAASLVERAQSEARQRRARYAYRCTQWHYEEAAETSTRRSCPSGTIQRFTPSLIHSVKQVECTGPLSAAARGRCWELDYQFSEGDNYYYYWVRVGGAGRPQAVWIEQYVPPPH